MKTIIKDTKYWHNNSLKLIDLLSKSLSSEYQIDRESKTFSLFVEDLITEISNVGQKYSKKNSILTEK